MRACLSCHAFYKDKKIEKGRDVEFLGLGTDKHLDWKIHTQKVITKIGTACYAGQIHVALSNVDTQCTTLHISI